MRLFLLALIFGWLCSFASAQDAEWLLSTPNQSPSSPIPRYHHSFTSLPAKNRILLFGGVAFDGSLTYNLDDTWLWNPNTNKWTSISTAKQPSPRGYHSAVTYKNKVIVYGGRNEDLEYFGDIWRFTPSTGTWKKDVVADAPWDVSRAFHAAAIAPSLDRMYVFGGTTRDTLPTNDLWYYDLVTKTWHEVQQNDWSRPNSPTRRQGHSMEYFDDPIWGPSFIVFGGYIDIDEEEQGGFDQVWQYIIDEDRWELLDVEGPIGRYGHEAVIRSEAGTTEMIIYGGMRTEDEMDTYFSDVWSLQLYGGGDAEWVELIPDEEDAGPGKRQGHNIAELGGQIYSSCGYRQFTGLLCDVWTLDEE